MAIALVCSAMRPSSTQPCEIDGRLLHCVHITWHCAVSIADYLGAYYCTCTYLGRYLGTSTGRGQRASGKLQYFYPGPAEESPEPTPEALRKRFRPVAVFVPRGAEPWNVDATGGKDYLDT